jgi:hypothetical protein
MDRDGRIVGAIDGRAHHLTTPRILSDTSLA